MKTFRDYILLPVIVCVCCLMGLRAPAALVVEKAPTKVAPKGTGTTAKGGGEGVVTQGGVGDVLREAYADLHRADHDYKGHRIDAMHQIEAAAKLLGEKLTGDGRGDEKQGISDEQLHAAQGLLEQARGMFGNRPKVMKHINNAINQLTIALKIK